MISYGFAKHRAIFPDSNQYMNFYSLGYKEVGTVSKINWPKISMKFTWNSKPGIQILLGID